jgi:predicted lipoprotein with Yx(FWY)xxD motif
MQRRLLLTLTGSVLAATALAGCSSGGSTGSAAGSTGSAAGSSGLTAAPAPSSASAAAAGATGAAGTATGDLATASTSLGTVVVDGAGKTAYFYDKDVAGSGTSTCTGGCATLWPAVDAASAQPEVSGVTGTVGTIPGVDGHPQLTIDGRPVYTYAGDSGPGDVTGQGVGGVWFVIKPDGTELTAAGTTSGSAAPSSTAAGGYTY